VTQRALATDPEETPIIYNVGCVYALSGEAEKAIDCLEKATTRGDWYKGWAQKDSDLDSLWTRLWLNFFATGHARPAQNSCSLTTLVDELDGSSADSERRWAALVLAIFTITT